ncbi:MAG: PorT family protein [Bacteroidales bacterium]|nr:PorT family protein [Bacteroidales bacterium]
MKKLVLILSISCISLIGYSQFQVGLKGAVTMSSLTTDINDYVNPFKAGFQAGAYVRLGKKLHLQPEAYFTAKTGELSYTWEELEVKVKETVTLSTIDVPLLLGYKIIDPKAFNVRLQAGPVASFVLNKSYEVSTDGVSPDTEEDFEDSLNDMNWALQFGAGVDVLFLTIDLRYELGLSNLYNQPDDGVVLHETVNNNLFFLSVGFRIFKI